MDDALAFLFFAMGRAFLVLPIVGVGMAWSARKGGAGPFFEPAMYEVAESSLPSESTT